MSIRTNPFKAVPLLLRRLSAVEKDPYLDDLKSELVKIKDLFSIVKRNEEELLDTLTNVDSYIRNFNIPKLMEEEEEICKRIRNSTQKLLPAGAPQIKIEVAESSGKRFQHVEADKRENMLQPHSSYQRWDLDCLRASYYKLDFYSRWCGSSFSHFPENAVIKKRHAIYWCIGARFVQKLIQVGVEDQGEHIFKKLLIPEIIVPDDNNKHPFVNKYKITPLFHHMLKREFLPNPSFGIYSHIIASSQQYAKHECLALDKQRVILSDGVGFKSNYWIGIFNVGASYLNFGPQWISKMKNLRVLHLGRWQDSTSHHIEVENEKFLNELRNLKYFKFLHLRGISGISKLPPSIVQLESLEFLDLKACHNLETIPNDIGLLKNLKHFNVSKCYLLESMPKGIKKLTKLQVLKGFLIGSSSKTPYRISDLANLKQLERLSIHIGSEAVIQDEEFESFGNLSKLKSLKISWGVSGTRYNDIRIVLPPKLEKLHLEGFPEARFPKLLHIVSDRHGYPIHPNKMMLCITGGKLEALGERIISCEVYAVRFKYVKNLKVDLKYLLKAFPYLKYAEMKQVLNHSYFDWSKL